MDHLPGDVLFDHKTGKERTFVRYAACGVFKTASIWSVSDCVAHSGSPVPWDAEQKWPWVAHVDVMVPCRDDGQPLPVTFTAPSMGPPGSAEWAGAELFAVMRMGVHEAMESFGFDPHTMGDIIKAASMAGMSAAV